MSHQFDSREIGYSPRKSAKSARTLDTGTRSRSSACRVHRFHVGAESMKPKIHLARGENHSLSQSMYTRMRWEFLLPASITEDVRHCSKLDVGISFICYQTAKVGDQDLFISISSPSFQRYYIQELHSPIRAPYFHTSFRDMIELRADSGEFTASLYRAALLRRI